MASRSDDTGIALSNQATDHRGWYSAVGIALICLGAQPLLFSDLSSIRVFFASFSVLFGFNLLIRAIRPELFLVAGREEKHFNESNLLETSTIPAKTRWGRWSISVLTCLLVSAGAAFVHHHFSGGQKTAPVISLGVIRQITDDEIAKWLHLHPLVLPPTIRSSDQEVRLQKQIVDIQKRLRELPPPMPEEAFYIRPETEITSAGYPGHFTGFFVGHPYMGSYILNPATDVVFVRITNLLPVRTMISRFESSLDHCSENNLLDTGPSATVFTSLLKGAQASLAIGRSIILPNNGTGTYMLFEDISDADLKRSARLDLPLLERLLSDHYLQPNETIGGWIFFESNCMGGQENFKVEDVAGRTFSYSVRHSNEMKTGDLENRSAITLSQAIDLSGSRISTVPWGSE